MLKIGLTGGIGCGKTTVSQLFAALDVPIIDADEISHQLVQPNQPALLKIQQTFGSGFLLDNGELNRGALKNYIFENTQAKKQLESILHPLIFQEIARQTALLKKAYCILSVPLLFETNAQSLVDRILVVDCEVQAQIERVQKRDNLSLKQIQAIIAHQVSRDFRKANAHDILDNAGNNLNLAEEVKKLHNLYLSLSNC